MITYVCVVQIRRGWVVSSVLIEWIGNVHKIVHCPVQHCQWSQFRKRQRRVPKTAEACFDKSKPIGRLMEGRVMTIINWSTRYCGLIFDLWLPCWQIMELRFIPLILIPFICLVVGGCISVKERRWSRVFVVEGKCLYELLFDCN